MTVQVGLHLHFPCLYSDQLARKNRTYHDGVVSVRQTGIYNVHLMDANSTTILASERHVTPELTVYAGAQGLRIGRFIVNVGEGEMVEAPTDTPNPAQSSGKETPGTIKFEILYTTDVDKKTKLWKDGHVELDSVKDVAVFFDSAGKQLHVKKQCAGLNEGAVFQAAQYIFEVCGLAGSAAVPIRKESVPIIRRKPAIAKTAGGVIGGSVPNRNIVNNSSPTSQTLPGIDILCIYTEDKQKKQKKWIDGVIKYDQASRMAHFEDAESGMTILRRSIDIDLLVDGYEFDSGRYKFQITMPVESNAQSPVNPPVLKRPRLSVKDARTIRNRPVDLYPNDPRLDEDLEAMLKRPDPLLDMFKE